MATELYRVIATFLDMNGKPVSGPQFKARLLDRDRLFDDKLGISSLDEDGAAEFIFSAADVLSIDSPGERNPDIYFVLFCDGEEVFRSDIHPDVDFDRPDEVTGRPKHLTRSFGPFPVVLPQ